MRWIMKRPYINKSSSLISCAGSSPFQTMPEYQNTHWCATTAINNNLLISSVLQRRNWRSLQHERNLKSYIKITSKKRHVFVILNTSKNVTWTMQFLVRSYPSLPGSHHKSLIVTVLTFQMPWSLTTVWLERKLSLLSAKQPILLVIQPIPTHLWRIPGQRAIKSSINPQTWEFLITYWLSRQRRIQTLGIICATSVTEHQVPLVGSPCQKA